MTDITLGSLAERVQCLERQNRWLRAGAVLAIAVLAAVVCIGQVRTPDTVEAERFVLRDQQGHVRAFLGVHYDMGEWWPSAKPSLAAPVDGRPGLTLFDAKGKERAGLYLAGNGRPHFGLFDADGRLRAVLELSEDGRPALQVHDAKGGAPADPTVEEIRRQLHDQLLTAEQKALLDRVSQEFVPEIRRINNTLVDLDDRLLGVEDWIAAQPAPTKERP